MLQQRDTSPPHPQTLIPLFVQPQGRTYVVKDFCNLCHSVLAKPLLVLRAGKVKLDVLDCSWQKRTAPAQSGHAWELEQRLGGNGGPLAVVPPYLP